MALRYGWDPEVFRQGFVRSRRFEQKRVKALSMAAQPLAGAIPTMRVLSIGDLGIDHEIMASTAGACTPDDLAADYLGPEESVKPTTTRDSDASALIGTPPIYKQRWWRILYQQAGGRSLVEVSAESGKCAKALIESPKWDGSEGELEGADLLPQCSGAASHKVNRCRAGIFASAYI